MSHPATRVFNRVVKTDTCWLWTGWCQKDGYGMIHETRARSLPVHRVVYEALVGPIPPGMQLDHLCRVRNCVNPEHLEAVTSAENTRRGLLPFVARLRELAEQLAAHPLGSNADALIAEARSIVGAPAVAPENGSLAAGVEGTDTE